jgi:MerR family transcriptional regulator/heat shock protein HspR
MAEIRIKVTVDEDALGDEPIYSVSVAAELTGLHAQTLRQWDRLGMVVPVRTPGFGRRYSERDIDALLRIQQMSQEEGINRAGIIRIMALEELNRDLRAQVASLRERVSSGQRVFSVSSSGAAAVHARGKRLAASRNAASGELRPVTGDRWGSSRAMIVWRDE